MEILRGKQKTAPRIVLYGVDGIGKSTLCAQGELRPIFIQTEDGLGNIDVDRYPLATTLGDVVNSLEDVKSKAEYKTVVIDSLDWLEKLVWQNILKDEEAASIGEISYGKGYSRSEAIFGKVLAKLNEVRDTGKIIIFTAHAKIARFESPISESFDRYDLDVHDKVASVIREWADCIFFANYDVAVKKVKANFGRVENKAVGEGERKVYTQDRPAWRAKNRYNLDPEIAFEDGDKKVLVNIVKKIYEEMSSTGRAPTPAPAPAEAVAVAAVAGDH